MKARGRPLVGWTHLGAVHERNPSLSFHQENQVLASVFLRAPGMTGSAVTGAVNLGAKASKGSGQKGSD